MAELDPAARFAGIYDILYGGDHAFFAAQIAFLREAIGSEPVGVLDAGCGTGRHLLALSRLGYSMVGADFSRAMLHAARGKATAAGLALPLVQCDLRRLPFTARFGAIVCLESPLAYLHEDADLQAALEGFWRVLAWGGRLVVDVFDYIATLSPAAPPTLAHFPIPGGRSRLRVRESHRYEPAARLWLMRQEFRIERAGRTESFVVEHRLRMREADEYAAALEKAGFVISTLLPAYPAAPEHLARERRFILVAEKRRR